MQDIFDFNSTKRNFLFCSIIILAGGIGFFSTFLGYKIETKFLFYVLFLLLILSVIFFGFISSYKIHGYLDILSPYVYFPLMYLVVYGVGPHKALTLNEETGYKVLLIVSLGFLSYLMGALMVSGILMNKKKRVTSDEKALSSLSSYSYKKIVKLTFFIGIISTVVFWAKAKGIPALASDLENSRVAALEGNGIPYYFSMSIMISVWVFFLIEKKLKKQVIYMILGMILLMSTGWRNTSVALICVAILIYHYRYPIPFRKLVFTGIILVVVIAVSGLFRIYSSDLQGYQLMSMMQSGNYVGAFFSYLYSYPVVFTDNLILVLDGFSHSMNFLHGKSLIWNFGLIIPGFDTQAFDFFLKDYLRVGFAGGGLPPTLLGDLYLNFNYIGIFLGMLIVGALNSFLHYKFINNKTNLVGLSSLIALYYLSVSIRGGIENITLITTWLLVLVFILSRISRIKISR
ncbi:MULTISPECIES: O-antigen polymerase [Priestia]|uniref:O-antigen polymerase n=1 Tax=Priestia TaxID=2800373 RepID=UPI001C8E246E|nr:MULTISPECIES: O-antigen polymerase [Priestia]MBY0063447.1 oligosaccharide repeat unit polymerase [Priestia aryabhattai]MDN3361242.1 O-antigen polymerase [Priestia megaterium]